MGRRAERGAGAAPLSGERWRRAVRRDWERSARLWERWEPQLMHALSGVSPALLRALDPRPGHRVLDFGCGSGEPALSLAHWVSPGGRVVGLDVSAPLLAVARRRARALGIRNVRFRVGDVTRLSPRGPRFDRVVSRFGLMFAEDVGDALRRARTRLKPGGRIALAVWGPARHSAVLRITLPILRRLACEPLPDPERSPHPLRLARPGLLPRLMRQAGFRAVRVRPVRAAFVYASPDEFARERMACSTPLRNACRTLSRAERRRVRDQIRRAAARYRDGEVLRLPAQAWVASGRK